MQKCKIDDHIKLYAVGDRIRVAKTQIVIQMENMTKIKCLDAVKYA